MWKYGRCRSAITLCINSHTSHVDDVVSESKQTCWTVTLIRHEADFFHVPSSSTSPLAGLLTRHMQMIPTPGVKSRPESWTLKYRRSLSWGRSDSSTKWWWICWFHMRHSEADMNLSHPQLTLESLIFRCHSNVTPSVENPPRSVAAKSDYETFIVKQMEGAPLNNRALLLECNYGSMIALNGKQLLKSSWKGSFCS